MTDSRAEMLKEVGRAGLQLTPGASVSVYSIVTGGIPIVVGLLTIALLVLQIVYAARKLRP